MAAHPLWRDALAAAAIAAVGGPRLIVRAREGPVRQALLTELARLSPAGIVRITADSDPETLGEGADVMASVAAGTTVRRPGLAARIGDRLLLVAGAERLPAATAGLIARAIDGGGLPRLVLLDEGIDDERVAAPLDERVAMRVDLDALSMRDVGEGAERFLAPSHHPPIVRVERSRDMPATPGQVSRLRSTRTGEGAGVEGGPIESDAALAASCEGRGDDGDRIGAGAATHACGRPRRGGACRSRCARRGRRRICRAAGARAARAGRCRPPKSGTTIPTRPNHQPTTATRIAIG